MILSNSVWSSAFSFSPRASKTIGIVFSFVLCLASHRRRIQYRIERLRHIRFAYVLLKTVQSLASTQKPHNPPADSTTVQLPRHQRRQNTTTESREYVLSE